MDKKQRQACYTQDNILAGGRNPGAAWRASCRGGLPDHAGDGLKGYARAENTQGNGGKRRELLLFPGVRESTGVQQRVCSGGAVYRLRDEHCGDKMPPGSCEAACVVLDDEAFGFVVGTIAGDDTIFVLTRTENHAVQLIELLKKMMTR